MMHTGFFRVGCAMIAFLIPFLEGLGSGRAICAAEDHDFTVTDSDGVYYGSGEHPSAPASIRADDVWAAIPEYKKIVDDNLTDDDAEYHLLMKRATERFQKALRSEAKRESYDMIAESGAVKANGSKKIPDATDDLVDLVTRD